MGLALRRLGASAVALGVVTLGIAGPVLPAAAETNTDNPSRTNPRSANYQRPVPPVLATDQPPQPTGTAGPTASAEASVTDPVPLIALPPQPGHDGTGAVPSATASDTPSPSASALPPGFAATQVDSFAGSGNGSDLAGTGGTWWAIAGIGALALGGGGFVVLRRR
ncbi:hypothetical protein [Raineyella sp. LH-20]|uniref:hypothetical protein n=1 Tax=Raineyella sp. LH-20 TaxID=3081204 RepID=UPI00295419D1|nr:hypothetical protein [Raineyella sp. LH-20]WOP19858.1 hypothetical protein R0146_06185 [Raineyella sp. LH-20]